MTNVTKYIVLGMINKAYTVDYACEKAMREVGKVKTYSKIKLPKLVNTIVGVLKRYNSVLLLIDPYGNNILDIDYYYAALIYNSDWDSFASMAVDISILRDKCNEDIVYNVLDDVDLGLYLASVAKRVANTLAKYNVYGLYVNNVFDFGLDDDDRMSYVRLTAMYGQKLVDLITDTLYSLHEYKYHKSVVLKVPCTMECFVKYLEENHGVEDDVYFIMPDDGVIKLSESDAYSLFLTTRYMIKSSDKRYMFTNAPWIYIAAKELKEQSEGEE